MAEKKSKSGDSEPTESATQKIDPEQLMGGQGEGKTEEGVTRKIEDVILEGAASQEAPDSAATMKVSQAELMKAMKEESTKAKGVSAEVEAARSTSAGTESLPTVEAEVNKSSARAKIDPTVATILGVALVLVACICSCALVIAVSVYLGVQ